MDEKSLHTTLPQPEKVSLLNKVSDIFVSLSIIALFFGTPLFFLGITLQGIFFEKQLWMYFWLFVGIVAYTISGVTSGVFRIRRTPLDIPILLVWFFGLVSLVFSVDPWRSFVGAFIDPSRGFLALTVFVLAYFFLTSTATPMRIRLMLGSVILSGFFILFLACIQIFAIIPIPSGIPLSTMGSITSLGAFLSMLLPLFIGVLFLLGKKKNWISSVASVGVFLGLLVNMTVLFAISEYVSWTAILAGLGMILLFLFSRVVRPIRWAWVATFAFVIILTMLMVQNVSIARVDLPEEVYSNTTLSWSVVKGALAEHSFFGVGPALYEYAFIRYVPEEFFASPFFQVRPMYAQSLFLELLATTGIVGGLVFVVFLVWVFGFGMYILSRSLSKEKTLLLILWSMTLVLWLNCLLLPCHGSLLIMSVLIGILTIIVMLFDGDIEERWILSSITSSPRFAIFMSFISLALMVGATFTLVFLGRIFVADIYAGIGIHRELSVASNGSVAYFSRAATLAPKEGYYAIRLSREFLSLAHGEALKPEGERDTNTLIAFLQNARSLTERARMIMPASVTAQENIAVVYDSLALFDSAMLEKTRKEYEYLLEMTNGNPEVYVKLGQLDMAQARDVENVESRRELWENAREKFLHATNVNAGYAEARYRLALAEDALGNLDATIRALEEAVFLSKGSQNIAYTFALAQAYGARNGGDDAKNAEILFRQILGVNDKEINTLLNLGLLYERTGERDKAVLAYENVLSALPEEGSEEARKQIETFIQTLRSGGSNFSKTAPSLSERIVTDPSDEVVEDSDQEKFEEIEEEGNREEVKEDGVENGEQDLNDNQ